MNIKPATKDLRIQRGDDFAFTFDIEVDGVVLDLQAATVLSQIRSKPESSASLIADFSVAVNGDNEITLTLTDTETAAITASQGYYDVLVDIAGDTTHYLRGEIVFTDTITTAS